MCSKELKYISSDSLFNYRCNSNSSRIFSLPCFNFPENYSSHLEFTRKMIGQTFMDEIDCNSFFDHIDDLLEFPGDDVEAGLANHSSSNNAFPEFPPIWTTQSESFPCTNSVFSGNRNSDLSAELSVPYEDIVQLEWLSNFVEDSFSNGSLTMKKDESFLNKDSNSTHLRQFQTSSPVSVLESSSSCSGDKSVSCSPETITPGRRGARSKRPRPATFNPRLAIRLISPTSSASETWSDGLLTPKVPSDGENNYAESRLLIKMPKRVIAAESKKKKKIKLSIPLAALEMNQNQNPPSQSVRKCLHCEVTKTPQWRAGPMGPKTLCNACGVRYKSGRLFPEYRPAASPTFLPTVHSNSHKKVLEMRNNVGEKNFNVKTQPDDSPPELIPNTNNSMMMDYMS